MNKQYAVSYTPHSEIEYTFYVEATNEATAEVKANEEIIMNMGVDVARLFKRVKTENINMEIKQWNNINHTTEVNL